MPNYGSTSSLEDLEDIVTCAVHLGLLEEARLLPCGHAFCRACLDECLYKLVSGSTVLPCPICRTAIDMPRGAEHLPRAHTHNQLLDHVLSKKCRRRSYSEAYPPHASGQTIPTVRRRASSCEQNSRRSVDQNYRHIQQIRGDPPEFPQEPLTPSSAEYLTDSSGLTEDPSPNANTTEYELCDLDSIRGRMKSFSSFKIQCQIKCNPCKTAASRRLPTPSQITSADLLSEHDGVHVVMVDSNDYSLLFRRNRGQVCNRVCLNVSGYPFRPSYVKMQNDYVFVSGILQSPDPVGLLVQFTLDGRVIRKSEPYSTTSSSHAPVGSFWVDPISGQIVLVIPGESRIVVLSSTLEETSLVYTFPNLHPQFAVRKCNTEEIWASCPDEGYILVIDEKTGQFCKLGTQQIYSAVPSDIIITTDERVVFRDSQRNRVFWIHKRNDCILVQRLTMKESASQSYCVTSMTALANGRILFTAWDRAIVVKPCKSKAKNNPPDQCSIL